MVPGDNGNARLKWLAVVVFRDAVLVQVQWEH